MPPMPPEDLSPDGGASLSDDYKLNFGRNLQAARKRLGLTQAGFAAQVGVTQGYISHVEVGTENLTLDTAAKLARSVGRELPDMLEDPGAASDPE